MDTRRVARSPNNTYANSSRLFLIFFFFQAEDGIRDVAVTGVQTCALPISAEFVRAPEVNCLAYPENLKWEEAAAIPLVFQTAWHMLVTRGELQAGEDVLILGAGSGVGSAAIQIAKFFGARVITTAGSEEKLAKAGELGADHLINYKTQKIRDEVRRITDNRGVDVVFEHVGTASWEDSVASLAPAGRLVTCGATTGYDAKVDLRRCLPSWPCR